MARRLNDGGRGHNSEVLTEEDKVALQLHYTLKIRQQDKKAAEAKAKYDAERNELNGIFSLVRGDLGIKRKEFEEVLALQAMGETAFLAHENRRRSIMLNQGLNVGEQLTLDLAGDTVDDAAAAEADGFRAGRRADDPTPPENISPILHPVWLKGWSAGQEANAPMLMRAQEIIEARSAAVDEDDDADDDYDGAGEGEEDPADAERRLRNSGFMDTGAEPKPPETFDPLVVNGTRYATKKLANEARSALGQQAADAREAQAAAA